jgi:hypothetical protein
MNDRKNSPSLATLFAQADGAIDLQTGGVVPPIQSATTFVRDESNELLSPNHLYSRDDNDLVSLAEGASWPRRNTQKVACCCHLEWPPSPA